MVSELLCIRILRGSLTARVNHPHRRLLLLSLMVVNLLNAAVALYFSYRAIQAEIQLERTRHRHSLYLSHHLRNALCIIKDAVFLASDQQTMKLCDDAVLRIISAFQSFEAALSEPSDLLFQEDPNWQFGKAR